MKKLSLSGSYILRYIVPGLALMALEEERVRLAPHTRLVLFLTITEICVLLYQLMLFLYVRRKKIEPDTPVNHYNDLYAGTLTLDITVFAFALGAVLFTYVRVHPSLDHLLLFLIGFFDTVRGSVLLHLTKGAKKTR